MTQEEFHNMFQKEMAFMLKHNKLVFPYPMQILDGNDITIGSEHGTRIGTSIDQKLAFHGAAPVAKQVGTLYDMSTQPTPGVSSTDYSARAGVQQINSVLDILGLASY